MVNTVINNSLSYLLSYCTPTHARAAYMRGTAGARDTPVNRSIGLAEVA